MKQKIKTIKGKRLVKADSTSELNVDEVLVKEDDKGNIQLFEKIPSGEAVSIVGESASNSNDDDNSLYIMFYNTSNDKGYYVDKFDTNVIKVYKTGNTQYDCVIFDAPPKTINASAFECTWLSKIKFPDSIEVIGESCFYQIGDYLTNIEFGKNLKRIEPWAFADNNKIDLSFMPMPSGIEYIGGYAFHAKGVFDFHKAKQIPLIENNSFNSESTFIVPDHLYDGWIAAPGWSNYTNIIKYSEWLLQE
jgi:hypothetical protein